MTFDSGSSAVLDSAGDDDAVPFAEAIVRRHLFMQREVDAMGIATTSEKCQRCGSCYAVERGICGTCREISAR